LEMLLVSAGWRWRGRSVAVLV